MKRNLILQSDSYKYSHHLQYPPGTTGTYSYIESRGGHYGRTVFFGLQAFLREYLTGPVVDPVDIQEAYDFCTAHGEPFNRLGWERIAVRHGGNLPIRIRAVAEGSVVPTRNVLMTVESTDTELPWLPSFLETALLRSVWYPTTVATQSWHIKRLIKEYLDETSDDPKGELPFKLHDFGARGVSSSESAGLGGMAHLVNFQGSDTVEGVRCANYYYDHKMAGFSIPAAEHSTVTSWGKDGEEKAYQNMLDQFARPGALVAVVSDSYSLWNAIENIWCGTLLEKVRASGATIVIRPDSGNPPDVVLKCLQTLERHVGARPNLRGFKVLPKYFRLIQGDGVDETSISAILSLMRQHKYSATNIAFGMGGALLQRVDRDTQRFAMKCSSAVVGGETIDVYKDPVDDPGKASKRGRLDLIKDGDGYRTVSEGSTTVPSELRVVFENGELRNQTTLDDVRKRCNAAL